jgi:thymidylate synthase
MKNNVDKQYLDFLKHILKNGVEKEDRTETGTISVFGYQMRFNMKEGFPLLTSKKMFTKGVIHELIWFLRGDTNIRYLLENGVHIWDGDAYKNYLKSVTLSSTGEWCKPVIGSDGNSYPEPYSKVEFIQEILNDDGFCQKWGELGPVYGAQWRSWGGIEKVPSGWHHNSVTYYKDVAKNDQITDLINDLKNNPDSRRLIVSAWNVEKLSQMTLPPCHFVFQCYTTEMTYDERIKWWCDSLGKSIYYADDFDSKKLDELGVPKRKLDLMWTQRSCDTPLGIPFNIASYAILLHLLAKEVNMIPNELIFSGGDCHIYINQIDGVKEQLKRETFDLPKLKLHNSSIFDLKYEDIEIVDYQSSPTIQFPLSN